MHQDNADRRVILGIALLGLLVACVILAQRNLYEDEWLTLTTIHKPFAEMWEWANTKDFHPPGSHGLDWLLIRGIGSARGLGLVHLLLWTAALTTFVLSTARMLGTSWARIAFAAVAFLHPQVLMWNSSLRWYPVWWSVALIVVTLALFPRRRDAPPGWGTVVGLGVASGALIYLDYLALAILPCLGVAWLVRHGLSRASLARLGSIALIAGAVAEPQIHQFTIRVLHQGRGHMLPPIPTALRMGHALTVGGAILPWHPIAVIVALGVFLPAGVGFLWGLPGRWRKLEGDGPSRRELAALIVLVVTLIGVGVATGAGSHIYSLLGVAPMLALIFALGAEHVRLRAWRLAAAVVTAVWVGFGAYHLIARTGTAKRQVNDHPEAIIARLEQLAQGDSALVLTNDLVLTFELNARRVRGATPLVVASCWEDRVHGISAGLHADPLRFPIVLEVEHPEGDNDRVGLLSRAALQRARTMIDRPKSEDLGIDPDYQMKNRLSGARLMRARLRVWYGPPLPGDWAGIHRELVHASTRSILAEGDAPGE